MLTKVRFHSEGNEVKHSSFPHRTSKKEMPCIASKMIPVHKLQVNRQYLGKPMQKTHFDRWAYVPFQSYKHSLPRRDLTAYNSLSQSKQLTMFQIHPDSTSQLTLKRYLLRKQKKNSKERQYYSQLVSPLQAWRKMRQEKSSQKLTEHKAFFLTQKEVEHINRINNFMRNKKSCDKPKTQLSNTLKLNT